MLHRHPAPWAALAALLLPAALPAGTVVPGGLLDPTGRSAYLATDAGIDAVGLGRGERLWSTTEAFRPLLVVGDRLYALARLDGPALCVRAFDLTARGRRVYQSARVSLPRWATADDGPGHTFRCTTRQERSVLHLRWEATAAVEGGPRKEAAGEAWVDLMHGTLTQQPAAFSRPAGESKPEKHLEKVAVRWRRSIGGQLRVLAEEEVAGPPGERRKRLVLRCWDERTGREGKPHELTRGSRLVVLAGLEGGTLWLRDALPSPDLVGGGDGAARSRWRVCSIQDGQLVARVPFVPGTQQATLVGDRAYCLAAAPSRTARAGGPRRTYTLYVLDVETGRLLWTRVLASKPMGR
jgi:hypothetical protein